MCVRAVLIAFPLDDFRQYVWTPTVDFQSQSDLLREPACVFFVADA